MTDMQQKMKQEEERLAKLDPWKVMNSCVSELVVFMLISAPVKGLPFPITLKKLVIIRD